MDEFEKVCKLLRYYVLTSTTQAGSGHATSSLSAVELMAVLFFKYFRFDLDNPEYFNNDRLIFSKGHAAPLFYSLYTVAGRVSEEEIMGLRQFDSVFEGHPTKRFKYTEVPTGSLGQGLSVGVGMALNAKMERLDYLTYVLLGDGEMSEGQIWEALEISSHYKLNNLIGIIDVNRLGQSGESLYGYDLKKLEDRIKSFGWRTYVVNNGHNLEEIDKAYSFVTKEISKENSPFMIIAKTVKGKGVSFLEDKVEWHGRTLSGEEYAKAMGELGEIDKRIEARVAKPESVISKSQIQMTNDKSNSKYQNRSSKYIIHNTSYKIHDLISTREAYGNALVNMGKVCQDMVVMDGDMKNSTFALEFSNKFPDKYFEMFIAEQNMVSLALGLSERGKTPYVSTFASFLIRASDQIRMAKLSGNHIVFCGSHAGVSIGEDGPSQMGLEDLNLFSTGLNTTVFYPCDAVSTEKLAHLAYNLEGIVYIRTTRSKTPISYRNTEKFVKGGSKTLKETNNDEVTVIAAGITVHEALKAYNKLIKEGIKIRIIDAYCIKPVDKKTVLKAAQETKGIITVEDHYLVGGLGDAILTVLAEGKSVPIYKLGVSKMPKSGTPEKLLDYEEISSDAIVKKVKEVLSKV